MKRKSNPQSWNQPTQTTSPRLPYINLFQQRGYKIDFKLLTECAYYPRQGCQLCKWEWPLPECQFAHILVDTRIGGIAGWKGGKQKKEKKEKVIVIWEGLPDEVKGEILEVLKEGGEMR